MGGVTTVFVTDADNREVLEYDGTSGAIQKWYAYGPGPNAVLGQMDVAADTRTTPVPDLLGSIVASMDAATGTLSRFAYRPYGAAAAPAPFAFTGQRLDAETGLYHYRARAYSPGLGRFFQTDPIGYQGGINLYAYVGNDPLNLVDPEGLSARRAVEGFAAEVYHNFFLKAPDDIGRALSRFVDEPAEEFLTALRSIPASGAMAVGGIARALPNASRVESSIVINAFRGRASEARVLQDLGLSRNTTAVWAAEGRSIPDALTSTLSVEIKDAANVALTRQLRIQTEAARAAGRESVLVTGERTCISGACSRAFDTIIRRSDLGPQ